MLEVARGRVAVTVTVHDDHKEGYGDVYGVSLDSPPKSRGVRSRGCGFCGFSDGGCFCALYRLLFVRFWGTADDHPTRGGSCYEMNDPDT